MKETDTIDHRHRRSIRLHGYDYRLAGAYFVTICVQERICLFGDIQDGEMILSGAGNMILNTWNGLPQHYKGVDIDAFVVMPNHIHGIIILETSEEFAGLSLPDVVHRFKSFTTALYRKGVVANKWQPFLGRLWQRNYYEHIIRNEEEMNSIREYVYYNPAQWEKDENNPGLEALL